ncbi:MAG: hypothetical protein LCH52_12205 [Bacteroidetes bacterium]|nr:hypothetical protein [Bacteroidota bacterium]
MNNKTITTAILIVIYAFQLTGCSIYSTSVISDYKKIKGNGLLIYSVKTKSGKELKFDKAGGRLVDSLCIIKGVTENKDTVNIAADSTATLLVKEYDQVASYLVNIAGAGALVVIAILIINPPVSMPSVFK